MSSSKTATSPFHCLPTAELTPSGLLLMDTSDGEVELLRGDQDIELRSDSPELLSTHRDYKDRIAIESFILTTHRLVFFTTEARFLHLSNIHAVSFMPPRHVFSTNCKISLATYSLGELLLVFYQKKQGPIVMETLEKTLERKAWETASRLKEAQQATSASKRRVGVDAILAQQKKKHDRAARLTEQAFTGDAETLLREATELVTIIQKYAATLEQQQSPSQKDASQLADMMQDMGMTSAFPQSGKVSANYYDTLARQLADFLRPKLTQGLMTLTDVYCLYNRARGTNLISPHDLLEAVLVFEKLPQLGMRLREFPSGVKVVQSSAFDEEKMAQKLQDMAKTNNGGFLTELEASRQLHISALLAKEQLLAAERKGYLCRDVTLETTRFYPNKFPEFSIAW